MTTNGGFHVSDSTYQWPVHVQRFDHCPPSCCQPHEVDSFPLEVLMTGIMPR